MKPEVRGKMMVVFLVSLLAFGFGTGTAIIFGVSKGGSILDQQGDLIKQPPLNIRSPNPNNRPTEYSYNIQLPDLGNDQEDGNPSTPSNPTENSSNTTPNI